MEIDKSLDEEKLTILKDGKEVECDILFTFDSEDTGKAYVGYTDNSFDTNGKKNIFVSSFDPILGVNTLEEITDQNELDMVNEVIDEIIKNYKG